MVIVSSVITNYILQIKNQYYYLLQFKPMLLLALAKPALTTFVPKTIIGSNNLRLLLIFNILNVLTTVHAAKLKDRSGSGVACPRLHSGTSIIGSSITNL